jgi:rhodanese-related sulfurtransferase
MFEVDIEALASAHALGAIVVDVREGSEYATGHVPGARLIPAREIRTRLYELPRGSTVYLICANGARSLELIPFMRAVGYDAYSVAGGMWAWLANGGHDPSEAGAEHNPRGNR